MARQLQIVGIWCLAFMLFLTGCQVKKLEGPQKTEVPFTVEDPDRAPAELVEIIEENKEGGLQLTFRDGGNTWLVRGYGRQKSGGYSISVNGVYQMGDVLHVDTTLIGPEEKSETEGDASFPYVILRVKGELENGAVFD